MPKKWVRSETEIQVLASELRHLYPIGNSGVSAWLRAHFELIVELRSGHWRPSESTTRIASGAWTFSDIARALTAGGIVYKTSARMRADVLQNRLREIRDDLLKNTIPASTSRDTVRQIVIDAVHEALNESRRRLDRVSPDKVVVDLPALSTAKSGRSELAATKNAVDEAAGNGSEKNLKNIFKKTRPRELQHVAPIAISITQLQSRSKE